MSVFDGMLPGLRPPEREAALVAAIADCGKRIEWMKAQIAELETTRDELAVMLNRARHPPDAGVAVAPIVQRYANPGGGR